MGPEKKKYYTPYEMSTIIERMIALNTITDARDYGVGEKFHSVEVHILSYIAEKPGITVTELAYDWDRTKGAISQIIKKLEKKGLIYREKEPGNKKKTGLYATENGEQLNAAHQEYDTRNYEGFLEIVKKYYSEEEIQNAFSFMETWIKLSMEWDPQ